LGPEVPTEDLIWQDPIPASTKSNISDSDVKELKLTLLAAGLSISQMVYTAWSSASTFRGSDKRGGANGSRLRLAPQKFWEVNHPAQLGSVLDVYEKVQQNFNASGKHVSLADVIVLGGCAAIEKAAQEAGYSVNVPFTPGRADASQEHTDIESFAVLEPNADGFRNYAKTMFSVKAEDLLVDKAQLMGLSAPEMTALVGGMRVLGATYNGNNHGVFTHRTGVLSNDFFVNLLDFGTTWAPANDHKTEFVGKDRKTGETKWTATRVDLIFGSNSELRAIAEVYGCADGEQKFVHDFVAAWNKVMNADRFDVN